jgi:HSP20 family molecular chaperone IbpA
MKRSAPNLAGCPSRAREATRWESVALRDLSECLLEAYDAVACRADEILRERGDAPGNELEDWHRAEAEVLQKIPIDVQESDLAITALVSMPGYSAREIELGLDAGWIVILGRQVRSQPGIESARSKDTVGHRSGEGGTCVEIDPLDFGAYGQEFGAGAAINEDERPNPGAVLDFQSGRKVTRQPFGILQLPAAVDPSRCCAVLHDGLLGIRMLKAQRSSSPATLAG